MTHSNHSFFESCVLNMHCTHSIWLDVVPMCVLCKVPIDYSKRMARNALEDRAAPEQLGGLEHVTVDHLLGLAVCDDEHGGGGLNRAATALRQVQSAVNEATIHQTTSSKNAIKASFTYRWNVSISSV